MSSHHIGQGTVIDEIIVSGTETGEGIRFDLVKALGGDCFVNVERPDLQAVASALTGGEGTEFSRSPAAVSNGLGLVKKAR